MDEVRMVSFRMLMEAMLDVMRTEEPVNDLIASNPLLAMVFPIIFRLVWNKIEEEDLSNGGESKGN